EAKDRTWSALPGEPAADATSRSRIELIARCAVNPGRPFDRQQTIGLDQTAVRRFRTGEIAPIIGDDDCDAFVEPLRNRTLVRPDPSEMPVQYDVRKLMRGDHRIDTARGQEERNTQERHATRTAAADAAITVFVITDESPRTPPRQIAVERRNALEGPRH